MLAEMYLYLKEKHPTHGLEIVFVSSDRDENSFLRYFSSMPWLAIPFDSLGIYKTMLSAKYGIRGIPALVILDSMSGEIVSDSNKSRQEVVTACNQGEAKISTLMREWIERVPSSTREMIEMLTLSCTNHEVVKDSESTHVSTSYLVRKDNKEKKDRIDVLVKQLLDEGVEETEAIEAARNIDELSESEQDFPPGELDEVLKYDVGKTIPIDDNAKRIAMQIVSESGNEHLTTVLTTLIKYCENSKKTPWESKFRSFNLSFKVADRIAR